MTREETSRLIAAVRVLWPHSNLGGEPAVVVGVWHSLLSGHAYGEVDAAVRELTAQGREHAPPVGVVVAMVARRETGVPEWDEVRAEVLAALTPGRGRYRAPRGSDPYQAPPAEFWSHPLVAQFMDGAWDEWRQSSEHDGTFHAQQREAYKALAARAERGAALAAVGAPRRNGLGRPDYLRALGSGEAA